jgi:SAM-dependent methyltransferase
MDLLRGEVNRQPDPPRILDYGCGTGGNTEAYAALGEVIGIEPDAGAIRLAHMQGRCRYCRASGTRLPFRSDVFAAVVASDVLEHIEDDLAAVEEIARVIRPGGTAIISVPAHPWLFSEHDAALHHFRRYSKTTLRRLLEQGGLRLRWLSYWNAALFPVICVHRMLAKRYRLQQPRSDTRSTPWLINEALAALLAGEGAILRHATLPWGLSLVGVADRT